MAWMRSAFSPVLLRLQYNALRIQLHTNSLILLKQLLAALAMGAHGAVGRSACESCLYIVTPCFHFVSAPLYLHIIHSSAHSTFNYIGYHFNKLISAFNRGNLVEARTIQVLFICIHQLLFTSLNILCQSVTEVFVYCPRVVQDARASPLRHETWWVKVVRWCFFNSTWSKGNMILSTPLLKKLYCFWQALIWEWTSSWWLRCQACLWGPHGYLWCPVLNLVLSPLWRNITVFFLNTNDFSWGIGKTRKPQ